jgi:hypothetical protein
MDNRQILNHYKQLLTDIVYSPRWDNENNPTREKIADIGERVNSPDSMVRFRTNEDYNLLADTINDVEDCFNDDWLPYEMFGLSLKELRKFLMVILSKFDEIPEGEWTSTIKQIHQEIKATPQQVV